MVWIYKKKTAGWVKSCGRWGRYSSPFPGHHSTFVLARAKQELGDNVLAVMAAASETFPQRELRKRRNWPGGSGCGTK